MRKKLTPIERLMVAMDACACARGEAQWTNGYRAAKGNEGRVLTPEQARLWDKEQRQWRYVGSVENTFRRIVQRLLREARNAK